MGKVKFNANKTKLGQGLLKGIKEQLPKLGKEEPKLGKTEIDEVKAQFEQMLASMVEKHEELQAELKTYQPDLTPISLKEQVTSPTPEVITQTVEKVVEKVETRTEVSVITKDKRSRKYSKLVAERVALLSHKVKAIDSIQDSHSIDLQDIKDHCQRLEMQLSALSEREAKLEAQIPEEKQEVKGQPQGLLYMGVAASILLSILSLILK